MASRNYDTKYQLVVFKLAARVNLDGENFVRKSTKKTYLKPSYEDKEYYHKLATSDIGMEQVQFDDNIVENSNTHTETEPSSTKTYTCNLSINLGKHRLHPLTC